MGDSKLKPRPRRCFRQLTEVVGVCLAVYCLLFLYNTPHTVDNSATPPTSLGSTSKKLTPKLLDNLSLGEDECKAAFPGLTKEIDDTVAKGPFTVKRIGQLGPLQGRIKDGQLYILHAKRRADLSQDMLNARTAAVHQLYRAVLTSPTPLPDTIFTLNTEDQPFGTAWQYSRSSDPSVQPKDPNSRTFLIPHFSFWSWPLPFIGSMSRAAAAIASLEQTYAPPGHWHKKIAKAVWRGTGWYNSAHSPRLRQNLLAATRAQPWADVETLNWTSRADGASSKGATNALMTEEFCRYKYVVHTEGVAYSGRFQFHQMCKSVVLSPPILWMQHTTHLVKPLFSWGLDLERTKAWKEKKQRGEVKDGVAGKKYTPTERVRRAWPVGYPPEEANIVFVKTDWSDLGDTVAWLEEHPQVAEGIARRQRELFADGGYYSPAAETCYWRALIRGWAEVVRMEGEDWEGVEGVTFEAFSLSLDMGV